MATGTFVRLDGAGNKQSFQVSLIGSTELDNQVVTDGLTGLTATVANHSSNNQNIASGVYSLLVGAIGKLANAAGVNFDAHRTGGTDGGSAAGVAAVGAMLEQEVRATSTTSVAESTTSATISVAVTANFVPGTPIVFEPGTANAETALITAVVGNTSVSVQFPPGGALYTHTANYTILAGLMNAARQAPGATGVTLVSSDGTKATYRYSITGFTPVATPTDFLIIQGSATKTVRIKSIKVGGKAGTAGQFAVQMIRRSSAGTLSPATLVAITPMLHDINDAALSPATAVVSFVQTGNYGTLGTLVAQGGVKRAYLNSIATGPSTDAQWEFTKLTEKSVILRGTSDFLCLNGHGDALPASAAVDLELQTEEDLS